MITFLIGMKMFFSLKNNNKTFIWASHKKAIAVTYQHCEQSGILTQLIEVCDFNELTLLFSK